MIDTERPTVPIAALDAETLPLAAVTRPLPALRQFVAPEPARSTLADRFLAELDACTTPDERRAHVWRFVGRIAESIWTAVDAREGSHDHP